MLQQAFGGLIGGAPPFRLADLVSLAALPVLVIGLVTVTVGRDGAQAEAGPWRVGRDSLPRFWPPTRGMLVDAALFAVSVFAICLAVTFGPDYVASGAGPGGFALDLIRPAADLAALGFVLPLVPRSPRTALLPVLGLAALTLSDILAVAQRSGGANPGLGSHLALTVALCLLAATRGPSPAGAVRDEDVERAAARSWRSAMAWLAGARMAGPAAALAAALVIAALTVFSHPAITRAVTVTGALVVVLMVIRLAWFTSRAVTVTANVQASDWVFHSLADSTSDTVLICDAGGTIEYVSPAVAEFGYQREALTGSCLSELVHPDDRTAAMRAATSTLYGGGGAATFSGRVKAADGSWRQVGATLSRYGQPGEPVRLLIACHDDSELAALRRELTQLTFHDGVTGLPNRSYLEDRVKHLRQGTAAAIMIGLDEEPLVADLGSQPGEGLVLAQAGRRLRAAAPPGAVVARWGSDQFAVLIDEGAAGLDPVQAGELAGRLAAVIAAEPFIVAGREVWMTASVGVATSRAAEADQVLGRAHAAMLKASQAGGGRVEVFSAQMQAAAARRARLSAQIGLAIAEQQLRIEYRPVAELATGLVTAVEAQPAWTADGEEICCEELLAVAEEAGLTMRLGDWLLRVAAGQVAGWRNGAGDQTLSGAGLGLVISFSGRQVGAPGFSGSVLSALDAAGLPPQALTVQVAERVLLEAPGPVAGELAGLRGLGVRLAIGDFGTGYASLSYLRRLAVDVIRTDASFTAGLGTDPTLTLLVAAAIGLGRDLGIEMIAAGVDRPDQAELLVKMGCGLGQGSWLGQPVAAVAGLPWHADHRVRDQAGDPACSPAS
jgi:diguanylate cyclase (GGDEF)-like protein/PAS domain S-box-containing protein